MATKVTANRKTFDPIAWMKSLAPSAKASKTVAVEPKGDTSSARYASPTKKVKGDKKKPTKKVRAIRANAKRLDKNQRRH